MHDPGSPASPRDVVVVGAGIVGLTSALALLDSGHRVEVWTADDPGDTPSAASAGAWSPLPQAPLRSSLSWASRSLQDFCDIARLPDTGVTLADNLRLGHEGEVDDLPPLTRMSPDLRECPPDRLPRGFTRGLLCRVPLIDMARYVPWALQRLADGGATVRRRRVESVAAALEAAPVVVNAAGLGARDLASDPSVQPVFTQYVVTENPEGLDRIVVDVTEGRRWVSVVPHLDRIHLGGVRVPGRSDPRPDRELASEVVQRCREIVPELEAAHVLRIDTGVLPTRPTMRVEAEPRPDGLVVHAYGLGGTGVTLSWGAAREVSRLVAQGR